MATVLAAWHRMVDSTEPERRPSQLWWFPPGQWLKEYRSAWLAGDVVAGITLAAYAIPVSAGA
jgi:sulfate permease, SulP family